MHDFADSKPTPAALLSATCQSGDASQSQAFLLIAGQPLISHQIRLLRKLGLKTFFIEVDQVPGALLSFADKMRGDGVEVLFVRSPDELLKKLSQGTSLIVQGETVVGSEDLIAEFLNEKSEIIVTVDGRDDNSGFERMDLNTRWAGLARFNHATIAAVADLPEGWSISSSLVRQGVQRKIEQFSLSQKHLQDGDLILVASSAAARTLTSNMLSTRAASIGGLVESRLFGPVVALIAPFIWRSNTAPLLVKAATLLLAMASCMLAWFGSYAAAASFSLLSILGFSIDAAAVDDHGEKRSGVVFKTLFWISLPIALIGCLWQNPASIWSDIFPGLVIIGLFMHAKRDNFPHIFGSALKSPAIIAIIILVSAVFGRVDIGAIACGLAQLVFLNVGGLLSNKTRASS